MDFILDAMKHFWTKERIIYGCSNGSHGDLSEIEINTKRKSEMGWEKVHIN